MSNNDYKVKQVILGQLEHGTDLYNGITRIIQERGIRTGRVSGIGAVQKAALAYYDQKSMQYSTMEFQHPMEILSLHGNITIKDDAPFLHAHVVLSDEQGNGRGGHLVPGGTPVFACELTIEELDGPEIVREADKRTGLTLWPEHTTL